MAMRPVKIADLKDHLSGYLRAVERGAEVVVTDRDRPIARISPISGPDMRARTIAPTRDLDAICDRDRPRAARATSSTAMLLEERGDR